MYMSHKTAGTEAPHGSFPRPIDLLQRLADTRLPIRLADQGDIETLRILKLGGCIKAAIPEPARLPGGLDRSPGQSRATVDEITKLGRSLLALFAKPSTARALAHPRAQCL
ncbi:hypothetical protein J7E62_16455 [Variovorax paradoxus]|nr:hypothetical protein [Variovorax paradoxus]